MLKNIAFIWKGLLGYDNTFANFLKEPAASFFSEEICMMFAV
jgi:hypothetical protein